ncbi:hypothetical protein [Plantactinospora sp. CA-290183]|uniref:hypothetical protein n=1 Tax=Plantactinospora sp. CA-290183 TaxID=3240006 RepID=UPI003D90340A
MILPANVANPVLGVLIKGSGYPSLAQVAIAINKRGQHKYGLELSYDHTSVKRWLRGGRCDHQDLVAEVLSDAWGVDVAPGLVWSDAREGAKPLPAHYHPFVATRTLEELGIFLRSDMLTRRSLLASSISVATGSTFVDSITRWLGTEPVGLPSSEGHRPGRIGLAVVEEIEQATMRFMAGDAEVGGGLSREAAVGQLKYAVDLFDESTYESLTGNRLLAAVAKLSGEIGYMSHDSGLEGPAQRYFVYGLQAARESTDERASLVGVCILADMARQLRFLGQPDDALRLIDLAVSYLPERNRHTAVQAMLWNLKAHVLASTGTSRLSEVRSAIDLASDLLAESRDEDEPPWQREVFLYIGDAELHRHAAGAYIRLGTIDPAQALGLGARAETEALNALAKWDPGFIREQTYSRIDLALARFLLRQPERACDDGEEAIRMSTRVVGSSKLKARLRDLVAASESFRDLPRVREFREILRAAT